MSWLSKTTFNPDIKNWSYSKIVKAFGEDKGALVAEKFGVKKASTKKKKATDSEGGN